MIKILLVVGTRPEAIKLFPVLLHLRKFPACFEVKCCATAQHRAMLDQVFRAFDVRPDYDLDLMLPSHTLAQSASRILSALEPVLVTARPDMVLVQGDTTTTFCAALAAFYARIHVGHVEAGLRTWDMSQPFPEELNRVLTTRLATLHFAPTAGSAENLLRDGVSPDRIKVTGNTGIDAVMQIDRKLSTGEVAAKVLPQLDLSRKLILVTAHRRENFGEPIASICRALARLASRDDVQIVYPLHQNPNIAGPVRQMLGAQPNIVLCEPLEYVPFVDLMRRSYFVITDSGGIQEEAPSLGKPVLVLREKTERPEAVAAGTVKLVGTDADRIVSEAKVLLEDRAQYEARCRTYNPYGDGRASERIAEAITAFFSGSDDL